MGFSLSDLWNYPIGKAEDAWNSLSGKNGYNTAAQGAGDVSRQNRQFSDTQWQRQMDGLQGAEAAYGPSQAYWTNTYGSQGPGAMENWYAQNGSKFGQEGAQQGAYNDYQSWMNQPGYSQLGYAQAGQSLAGSNNSAGAYGAMGQGLQNYSGPQNGQEAYRYNQGSYQQPGAAENYYAQSQPRYNQETNSQANYEAAAPQLYSEGYAEKMAREGHLGTSIATQALAGHQAFSQGPTALQQNENENKGYIRNANDVSDYYNSQRGALSGPGQYEQFVSSDINGTNPEYQRTRQQGIASINQEMARRGGFGSGGAMTAIGNYTGALDAADYNNRAQRAQQAQQMELARIGQGTQSAQASVGQKMGQASGLGSLDTASEQAGVARQGVGLSAEQQASNEAIASQQLQLGAARQADDAKLARLMGTGQLAQGADSNNLGLLNAGQNASNNAQSQMLARLMGYQNSANSVDQTQLSSDQQGLQRMLASFNMAQGTDQTALARAQQQYGMGMGMDQFNMSKYAQQANQAQGLDQYNLASLLGGGQMANQAQNAQQQRQQQAMASLFGINNAQAGQYGQFYGQGGQLSGSAFSDAMNALMAQYGYQGESQNAGGSAFGKILGQLYGNLQTGVGGIAGKH